MSRQYTIGFVVKNGFDIEYNKGELHAESVMELRNQMLEFCNLIDLRNTFGSASDESLTNDPYKGQDRQYVVFSVPKITEDGPALDLLFRYTTIKDVHKTIQ